MRAAVFQSDGAGITPGERLAKLRSAAATAEADLLLCPELFLSGYGAEAARRWAEPADGPFAAAVAAIAKETGVAIAYGYPEAEGGVLYNAAQCFGAGGARLANHRKLALPPGFEREVFAAGAGLSAFALGGLSVGLLICYDLEFPEAARALAQEGVQAILAPTALAAEWSVVAERLVPTRAFENGVYVLYANHAGHDGALAYYGGGCVIGPDGVDRARAGREETVIAATLDPAEVAAAQARLPYLDDAATLRLSAR